MDGWDFQRFYLLFVGAAFLLLGLQVLHFHWRAGFGRWTMYVPVLAAPLLALAAVVAAVSRDGALGWIALVVLAFGVAGGLLGVFEHARGVLHRIGGLTLRNIVAGPPTLPPATFAAAERDLAEQAMEAAGATRTLVAHGTHHLLGTCRMGTDPATSVVGPDCRSHDIPNRWICDGSVFPTGGAVNPSLTIEAIATRTARPALRERSAA